LSTVEISLAPVDNEKLSNLCGVLDENIKQIEAALDVSVNRRGENFSISGEEQQVHRAAEALRRFYALSDHSLTIEDVQLGLIEIINPVIKVVGEEEPALITRRRDLHGRTPHQVQYLRHIQEYDITFGIGPAGTGKT